MIFNNLYHSRKVAQKDAGPCWICKRPSTTVMATPVEPDKTIADWFWICPGHLKDRGFATAVDAEDAAEKKRKEEFEKEIEKEKQAVIEEKMRKKLARRKQKEYEKDEKKDGKDKEDEDDKKDEKEKEEKLKELEKKKETENPAVEGPRKFELHKSMFQDRVLKKRNAEMAKRNIERLRSPGAFPTVPSGGL